MKYDLNNNDGGSTPTQPQEEELVLPSVKKIATLFCRPAPAQPGHRTPDKPQHQNKPSAICPQPGSSSEAGGHISTNASVSQSEQWVDCVQAECGEPVPAMLTVRGQSCTNSQVSPVTCYNVAARCYMSACLTGRRLWIRAGPLVAVSGLLVVMVPHLILFVGESSE